MIKRKINSILHFLLFKLEELIYRLFFIISSMFGEQNKFKHDELFY